MRSESGVSPLPPNAKPTASGGGPEAKKLPPKWEGLPAADLAALQEARAFALSDLADRDGRAIATYIERYPCPVDGMSIAYWMDALMELSITKDVYAPMKYVLSVLKRYQASPPRRGTPAPPGANGHPTPRRQRAAYDPEATRRVIAEMEARGDIPEGA